MGCPCGVAVSPTSNQIAVADNAGRLEIFNANGEHKFHLSGSEGLKPGTGVNSFPYNVTVSSDGKFYVTNETPYVRIYDADGWYKGQFDAIPPESKPSEAVLAQANPSDREETKLCGLAINSSDELFVGEITQKYISKHSQKGSHISSLKVGIAPSSLAATPQGTIIISDWFTKMIHIIDYTGQLLHHIKPSSTKLVQCSYGITFFSDLIFTCNHHSKSICCFSLTGKHLGCLPIEIPSDPSCITFTPNGSKMLVTYGDSEYSPPSGVAVYRL